jgi:hypothetical protein
MVVGEQLQARAPLDLPVKRTRQCQVDAAQRHAIPQLDGDGDVSLCSLDSALQLPTPLLPPDDHTKYLPHN